MHVKSICQEHKCADPVRSVTDQDLANKKAFQDPDPIYLGST